MSQSECIARARDLVTNPYKILDLLSSVKLTREQRAHKEQDTAAAVEKEVARERSRDRSRERVPRQQQYYRGRMHS